MLARASAVSWMPARSRSSRSSYEPSSTRLVSEATPASDAETAGGAEWAPRIEPLVGSCARILQARSGLSPELAAGGLPRPRSTRSGRWGQAAHRHPHPAADADFCADTHRDSRSGPRAALSAGGAGRLSTTAVYGSRAGPPPASVMSSATRSGGAGSRAARTPLAPAAGSALAVAAPDPATGARHHRGPVDNGTHLPASSGGCEDDGGRWPRPCSRPDQAAATSPACSSS